MAGFVSVWEFCVYCDEVVSNFSCFKLKWAGGFSSSGVAFEQGRI
jgi:hypothetical protein